MTVFYEWDVELVDIEHGDIHEHYTQDNYKGVLEQLAQPLEDGLSYDVVLVCNEDKWGRSWAYVVDGKLPAMFTDAFGDESRKVPVKYQKEIDKAVK